MYAHQFEDASVRKCTSPELPLERRRESLPSFRDLDLPDPTWDPDHRQPAFPPLQHPRSIPPSSYTPSFTGSTVSPASISVPASVSPPSYHPSGHTPPEGLYGGSDRPSAWRKRSIYDALNDHETEAVEVASSSRATPQVLKPSALSQPSPTTTCDRERGIDTAPGDTQIHDARSIIPPSAEVGQTSRKSTVRRSGRSSPQSIQATKDQHASGQVSARGDDRGWHERREVVLRGIAAHLGSNAFGIEPRLDKNFVWPEGTIFSSARPIGEQNRFMSVKAENGSTTSFEGRDGLRREPLRNTVCEKSMQIWTVAILRTLGNVMDHEAAGLQPDWRAEMMAGLRTSAPTSTAAYPRLYSPSPEDIEKSKARHWKKADARVISSTELDAEPDAEPKAKRTKTGASH